MKIIRKIFKWIKKNRKWVFSGIGITILSLLSAMLFNGKDDAIKEVNNMEINGNVNGNIYQNSTVYNLSEDIEKQQTTEKEQNETSYFQKVIELDSNKYWFDKDIIGIPYKPNPDMLKWINNATDYTNDWDAYDPTLFSNNEDTALENIGLVGKTENFLLYDSSLNDGSMLIKTSEDSYVLAEGICSTSTTGGSPQPSMMEADYDNDGDNELAICVWLLHGTGLSRDSLFMVDKASDGQWYMFQFQLMDCLDAIKEKYTREIIDDKLYFVWNNNRIDIPQKLENKEHFDYYGVGQIVDIEVSYEEILIKLSVGYIMDDTYIWDYSRGHGISAKVQYQGEGKWELANYDYYNDSLEKYITQIMDLYFTGDTEHNIVKILYDSSKFGDNTFRVDVLYTVDYADITYLCNALLTIKQIDASSTMSYDFWEICDFFILPD